MTTLYPHSLSVLIGLWPVHTQWICVDVVDSETLPRSLTSIAARQQFSSTSQVHGDTFHEANTFSMCQRCAAAAGSLGVGRHSAASSVTVHHRPPN